MPRIEVFECDVCGKAKGESNHWYIVLFGNNVGVDPSLGIFPWNYYDQGNSMRYIQGTSFVCGENCLNKWISSNLPKLYEREKENANTSNEHGNSV